jgi:3-dehydroquinate dehydratase-2
MQKVFVLNGPNLNMLGSREPEVYGFQTLSDVAELCRAHGAKNGLEVDFRQTNSEAEMVGWLHEAFSSRTPVVINPAALTHYSYSLRDACAMVSTAGIPLIEVHISNPHSREEFRQTSVISSVASGVIAGFGPQSYLLALSSLSHN